MTITIASIGFTRVQAQDPYNDGVENGIFIETARNTVEWTGIPGMSPLRPVTEEFKLTIDPFDPITGGIVDQFEPELSVLVQARPTPGTWSEMRVLGEPDDVTIAWLLWPQVGQPGDNRVDATIGDLTSRFYTTSSVTLQLWWDFFVIHQRNWSEALALGSKNYNCRIYFEYETPFSDLAAPLGGIPGIPAGTEYRVLATGVSAHNSQSIVFGQSALGHDELGLGYIDFEWNVENKGDEWLASLLFQIQKPNEPLFSTYDQTGQFFLDIDPVNSWTP